MIAMLSFSGFSCNNSSSQNYAINSNSDWASACGAGFAPVGLLDTSKPSVQAVGSGIMAIFLLFGLFVLSKFVRRHRAAKAEGRLRLPGNEVSMTSTSEYGSISSAPAAEYAFTPIHYGSPQGPPYAPAF